jgi:hypothetical protein
MIALSLSAARSLGIGALPKSEPDGAILPPSLPTPDAGTAAVAKIDVVRMHAADIYASPAVGEFFDCKCWRNETASIFFGPGADVERSKIMLATIRSAMDREFADFVETGIGGGNSRSLAASFSKGMGHRISERLRRLKAGRTANIVARGKDLAAMLFPTAPKRKARSSISTIAYAAGVAAGDRVELSCARIKS